jgi:AcrR family transcriptional regulator
MPKPARRRRLSPADRRAELKAAGAEVFEARGFGAATVDDIVRAAGAAKGTFYCYFPTKKALFLELLDDFARAVRESFAELDLADLSPPAGDQPVGSEVVEAVLRTAYRRFFDVCQAHRPLARLFLQEVQRDAELQARRRQIYDDFAGLATRGLEAGIALGVVRPLRANLVAHAIVGLIERVTVRWLLEEPDLEVDAMAQELARFEALGIARSRAD